MTGRALPVAVLACALLLPGGAAPARQDERSAARLAAYRVVDEGRTVHVLYLFSGSGRFLGSEVRRRGRRLLVDVFVPASYNDNLGFGCVAIRVRRGVRRVIQGSSGRRVSRYSRADAETRDMLRTACRHPRRIR